MTAGCCANSPLLAFASELPGADRTFEHDRGKKRPGAVATEAGGNGERAEEAASFRHPSGAGERTTRALRGLIRRVGHI